MMFKLAGPWGGPVRKILESIGLGALAALVWITWSALLGPDRLPARIPTHFSLAGRPDDWGSPFVLLLVPALAVAIYLLISAVERSPRSFNLPAFPEHLPARNRPRLKALALDMVAWLKMELACFFAGIQWGSVQEFRHPRDTFPLALMPAALVVIFATAGWFIGSIFRAGRAASGL